MMKGFNFTKVIILREHQPKQLGEEINRPHVNFAISAITLKGAMSSLTLLDQSLNLHGNMLVSV